MANSYTDQLKKMQTAASDVASDSREKLRKAYGAAARSSVQAKPMASTAKTAARAISNSQAALSRARDRDMAEGARRANRARGMVKQQMGDHMYSRSKVGAGVVSKAKQLTKKEWY